MPIILVFVCCFDFELPLAHRIQAKLLDRMFFNSLYQQAASLGQASWPHRLSPSPSPKTGCLSLSRTTTDVFYFPLLSSGFLNRFRDYFSSVHDEFWVFRVSFLVPRIQICFPFVSLVWFTPVPPTTPTTPMTPPTPATAELGITTQKTLAVFFSFWPLIALVGDKQCNALFNGIWQKLAFLYI